MPRGTKLEERKKATAKEIKNGSQQCIDVFFKDRVEVGQKRKIHQVNISEETESSNKTDVDEKLKKVRHLLQLPKIKQKRISYSNSQKQTIVKVYEALKPQYGQELTMSYINKLKGYDKVSRKMIESWVKPTVSNRRGPRLNNEFENEVLSEVIITHISDRCDSLEILANAAFSYECFIIAAKKIQKKAEYLQDKKIQNLKFSSGWIQKFLRRQKLKRRRCTTVEKVKPSYDEVVNTMSDIQHFIESNDITPERIFNEDETGVRWCPALLHQYVPNSAERAVTPSGDSSGRFTALIGASAAGNFLPSFIVLQCNCQDKHNLSGSTLLNKFLNENNICANGWDREYHSCIIKNKKDEEVLWQRPYLINRETYDIITVQNSAWNDSAAMILHIEKQLKPYKEKHFPNLPCLLIVDNVSFHKVHEVVEAINHSGWAIKFLPANMTDELQPMDLVVNAVVKTELRKFRIDLTLDYIPTFKSSLERYQRGWTHEMPIFDPPAPTSVDGVRQIHKLYAERFDQVPFKEALKNCFKKVGLTQSYAADGSPYFMKYQSHQRKGTLQIATLPHRTVVSTNEFNSLAGLLTDIEMRSNGSVTCCDSLLEVIGEIDLDAIDLSEIQLFDEVN